MNTAVNNLKLSFINEKIGSQLLANENDIQRFTDTHDIQLPDDLVDYFKKINGTDSKYDQNFFQFYSLKHFKSVEDMYLDWEGIPDFKAVTKILPDYQNCFVIADYSIHVISYSIRLFPNQSTGNEVYAVSGANYERVAESFTEFIELYLSNFSSLLI